MKPGFLSLVFFMAVFCFASAVRAADNSTNDYIKVEIKGTLATGMMAMGGETTGTVIRANNATLELDLKGDGKFSELATNLNKKSVIVTGTFQKVTGMAVK